MTTPIEIEVLNNEAKAFRGSLADALPLEIERVQLLLADYISLGLPGAFGAAMLRKALADAVKAMMSGDVGEMLRAHEALRGCE